MSDKRAVINVEQAIKALPDKDQIVCFLLVEERGRPKRILKKHSKEMIINMLTDLGGADVSGEDILKMGFGLAVPLSTSQGERWFFMETRPNYCPFCQGLKVVRDEADFEIVRETCWVCNGEGFVLTLPVPEKPAQRGMALTDRGWEKLGVS